MSEITVAEAARRLGVSEQRAREMLRHRVICGRRIGRAWLVDTASVHRRSAAHAGHGRAWSEATVRAIVTALSDGVAIDSVNTARLRQIDTETLWRKIAQVVNVAWFTARDADALADHLVLTGESAIDHIGERLVGDARTMHGYLRGMTFDDALDAAGLVENSEGNVALYTVRSGNGAWVGERVAARALIAVDCARSTTSRVHAAGLRALDEMKQEWLTKNHP